MTQSVAGRVKIPVITGPKEAPHKRMALIHRHGCGWALHRSVKGKRGLKKGWTVTHEASGKCFASGLPYLAARRIFYRFVSEWPNPPKRIESLCRGIRLAKDWRRWYGVITDFGIDSSLPDGPMFPPPLWKKLRVGVRPSERLIRKWNLE